MSVWKDERGRYHTSVMYRGKRVHRVLPKTATREQAHKLETRIRQELFRVIDLGEAPTVGLWQALQRYVNEHVVHQKAAHKTGLVVASLERWVSGKALADAATVAQAVIVGLQGKSAPATINRKLSVLKRVAHLAYSKWGWLTDPIHDKITKLPGEISRHTYLSQTQINGLVRALASSVARDAVVLAAFTGLRQGELWALQRGAYRDGAVHLADSKAGIPRAVPIIPKIRPALKRWLAMELRPHPRTVYKDFERARVKIGMPDLRFHDLRHSCASMLAAEGVDLGTIGSILGHTSTQTTKRYAHLSMEAKRRALKKIG